MNFVHIADMHFDSPFSSLAKLEGLADIRRMDQRKIFRKIIEYISENKIENLFVAGDFLENDYIRLSTVEFINKLFANIPETRIFITPGNHDPYLVNSYYSRFEWAPNVYIFENKLKKLEFKDFNLYGWGFGTFYSEGIEEEIKNLELDKNKINILIMHADLDSSKKTDKPYNPINSKVLNKFDYVALGHIHKRKDDNNIVYPGSTISHGFDELGEHGFICGKISLKNELEKEKLKNDELNKNELKDILAKKNENNQGFDGAKIYENNNSILKTKFIPLDDKEFVVKDVDISEINSKEDLAEKINELDLNKNKFYEINLIGTKKINIDTFNLYYFIEAQNILKIKDNSKVQYSINEISNEISLRGILANNIKNKIESSKSEEEKEKLKKAMEIALEALEK